MTGKNHEIIGNYEVSEKGDVISRREALILGAIAAGGLVASSPAVAAPTVSVVQAATGTDPYIAKDFSHLQSKLDGFTAGQIDQHLKLYKGYIGKANELTAKLKGADLAGANPTYSPLREMLVEESYAVNGVVYHELYFGNLGGKGGECSGDFRSAVEERWSSHGKFIDYLTGAGKCMRGWVIVGYNLRGGHLSTFGLDMHNMWSPANVIPVLALDVYEHAYMIDFGIDRGKYLGAFVKNIDWDVVQSRFAKAQKYPTGMEST